MSPARRARRVGPMVRWMSRSLRAGRRRSD